LSVINNFDVCINFKEVHWFINDLPQKGLFYCYIPVQHHIQLMRCFDYVLTN
jgi:hypothetical protein